MNTLILWTLLSVAMAAVPEADWAPLVGADVVLVNPAGKEIKGRLLSADGDEVVILRSKDERRFTIPKADVESVTRQAGVEGGLASGEEIKEKASSAAATAGEATAGAVKDAKNSTAGAVEGVGDKLDGVAESLRSEPVSQPAAESVSEPVSETAAEPASSDVEATPVPESPVAGVQADTSAPELKRPVLGAGTTYAEGLEAGKLAAEGDKSFAPLGIAAGATCCATAAPCVVVPIVGGCAGLAVGAAGPIYYAGVRPYVLKDKVAAEMVGQPTEYAAGYVRGYTDSIQRRETLLAGIGSAAGLATGLVVGYVGFSMLYGGI